jgi:hypothetical protein
MSEVELIDLNNEQKKKTSIDVTSVDPSQISATVDKKAGEEHENEEEEEEEGHEEVNAAGSCCANMGKRVKNYLIGLYVSTKYQLYHEDKRGNQYFCSNTLNIWFMWLIYLFLLYCFYTVYFVCVMMLSSLIQGITFIPFASVN